MLRFRSIWFARLAIILAFFALWEIAPRVGLMNERLLPPLSDVIAALIGLLGSASFYPHLGTTLFQTLLAFLIAVPAGAILGILIAENRFASEVFKPLVFFIFSIPKSIFLPMFILAFGIGLTQKVAFGVFSTIFIVMMTAFAAIASVKEEHLRVARSYGASTMQVVLRVYLPSMTPVLLEAVRLAMIFNFTGILLAEMYASRRGLGNLIGTWGMSFQLDQLLAAIILISGLSIVFNETIRALELRLEHWRG
ncbi:ABC transporter permease [Acuticoccus sp. M5D2P5]|uniref:ABC transporter permease n=1 Tax=Acuticoccus kalidii TaxID=2910977 RepID=UPI001F3418F9|nr:ABC transporter permease [Acuticoccus kalidii]MCF3933171.1 ABC transporter permease [Acuticoccus kalidii]